MSYASMERSAPDAPIIIVGAGLVGLTLAQSLRQNSIPFEIYERDESIDANTQGWGVTLHWAMSALKSCISPEMFENLKTIQVDPQQSMNSEAGRFQFLNLKTLETRFSVPPSERIRINRRKFRAMLTEGIPVTWNRAITGFEPHPDTGTIDVKFHDATETTGCLLIGADGSSSRTRRYMVGEDTAKLHQVPVSLLGVTLRMTEEEIKPLRDIDPLLFNGTHPDTNTFLWYSLLSTPEFNGSAGKSEYYEAQLIFSWLVKSPEDAPPDDRLARIAKMKEIGQSCDARISRIMNSIPDNAQITVINLTDWPTIPWDNHGGLITLTGDAAHPMTMYRGEGANHGLADAAALGEQIAAAYRNEKSLAQAITDYESEMQPRGRAAVLLSRQAALDAHDFDNLTANSPLVNRRAMNAGL